MNLQHERIRERHANMTFARHCTDGQAMAQRTAETDASFADFLEQRLAAEYEVRIERTRPTRVTIAPEA
jgi:hypothetical protein